MTNRRPAKAMPARMHAHVRALFKRNAGYSALLILGSMVGGTIGFHASGGMPWIDAWLNAAMLLGGMGPVGDPNTWGNSGKLFASAFALYAGLAFLFVAALLLQPVFHHVLHRYHLEDDEKS